MIPNDGGFIRAVTEFVFVRDDPAPADVLLVPGSRSPENAELAAELWKEGYAPLVLPSGRFSIGLDRFQGPREDAADRYPGPYDSEWDYLRDVLERSGVPAAAILREDRATFTWENALFSRQVLEQAGIPVRRAILCCKPWHARRAELYYQTAFPDTELLVCPCPSPELDRDTWYRTREGRDTVLGEVRRLGDQIGPQFEMMMEDRP